MSCLKKTHKIFVAGHNGLVGSAIVQILEERGYSNLLLRERSKLNLSDAVAVRKFFEIERPEVVFLAAAKVGGILANNTQRAEFIYENLNIQNNIIWSAHSTNVDRLIFLGSSCIYPREASQPMKEDCLLSGPLEYTNRPYAIAKIAGLELINSLRVQYGRDYFSVMPTNLYGPRDNFKTNDSHVLPALLKKFINAKELNQPEVTVWGSGKPYREFMYSLDCADAIVHLAENVRSETIDAIVKNSGWSHINVGSGQEVSIAQLSSLIAEITGYTGKVALDPTKPDGTPRKLLDCSILKSLGWSAKITLSEGLKLTFDWLMANPTYLNEIS